jgi:hypothetical protein
MRKNDVAQVEKNLKMHKIAWFVRNFESHTIASDQRMRLMVFT